MSEEFDMDLFLQNAPKVPMGEALAGKTARKQSKITSAAAASLSSRPLKQSTRKTLGEALVAQPLPQVDPESLAPTPTVHVGPIGQRVAEIEARFLEVTGLTGDLATRKITQDNHLQVKTDKSKSDNHGEVFTPLWLVDDMIDRISDHDMRDQTMTTADLCAGYGQFTLRVLRRKYELLSEVFEFDNFLGATHMFIELQPNSCYRLLYIFDEDIRLLIGDATKMSTLPDDAKSGIRVEKDGVWYDATMRVKALFHTAALVSGSIADKANHFESQFNQLKAGLV